jgi:hypothetical protein
MARAVRRNAGGDRRRRRRGVHCDDRGTRAKASGLLVREEKRFDLALHDGILAAGPAYKQRALVRCEFDRGLKNFFDAIPERSASHRRFRIRPVVIRRYSHARAVCHSLVTVERETPSTSAISLSVRPPKYRSSTS